ncbi:filamentous hemagglutinin N-terminal domain-containing protein [Pantanalinema sp. GBBB05]|uniref:two-partner secretion domain-containing protein n=1 Tax=Pantanalinema sp. GBBB05 TaxID=2604139 RepID=UPI001DC8CED8|nr:S-layer family protein [Pantanalinema sp. GBBB05]
MQQNVQRYWSLLVAIAGSIASTGCFSVNVAAQIEPDDTLGAERSRVRTDGDLDIIDRGATRGTTLFHSFRAFNVGAGRSVYFLSPSNDIRTILARVTGNQRSEIFGTLGTYQVLNGNITAANANLFLINPNGIIFGANARLDVDRSFVATTANSILFPDGNEFSATDPQAPPLLTMQVPIGLQYGSRPAGDIVSQGVLAVNSGQSLVLAGGNLQLDQSVLGLRGAQSGRIELGAVAGSGTVGLTTNGNLLSLTFPEDLVRGNVAIANQSIINVVASNGGSLTIHARNLDIAGGSRLLAGILPGSGTVENQAGDLTLDVTQATTVREFSLIGNSVFPEATGNGGDVRINTGTLALTDGSQILVTVVGTGNAGNAVIQARDRVTLSGTTTDGQFSSGIFTRVAASGRGNSGDIRITTGTLHLSDQATLTTDTLGLGNAGNVMIQARDQVTITGDSPNGVFTTISTKASSSSPGRSGKIQITTEDLVLANGGLLNATTFGKGKAGDIDIQANTVSVSGDSVMTTETRNTASGDAGDIVINTERLSVREGGGISAATYGTGQGGAIRIRATDDIEVVGRRSFADGTTRQSSLSVATLGPGQAGDIELQSNDRITVQDGTISSSVEPGGSGNAGTIRLQTNVLNVLEGGEINAIVFRALNNRPAAQGNGGSIAIQAHDRVLIDGSSPISGYSSGIFTTTERGAIGQAGDIRLRTNDFQVSRGGIVSATTSNASSAGNITIDAATFTASQGGQVVTHTRSSGNAGTIRLNVSDTIVLTGSDPNLADRLDRAQTYLQRQEPTGLVADVILNQGAASGLFANTTAHSTGRGGSIAVTDPTRVEILDGAGMFVNSQGTAPGGTIQLSAGRLTLDRQAQISAETASNQGGNIVLQLHDLLLLRRGSLISATAGTVQAGGDGGNITIAAPFIIGILRENSDIIANAFTGKGGNITITTNGIFGLRLQPQLTTNSDITASSQFGISGSVTLNLLGIDPSRGFVSLPLDLADPAAQIAQECSPTRQAASSFVSTGRGGIPLSPDHPLRSEATIVPWIEFNEPGSQRSVSQKSGQAIVTDSTIVEAQGWIRDAKGHFWLVANVPSLRSPNPALQPVDCGRPPNAPSIPNLLIRRGENQN